MHSQGFYWLTCGAPRGIVSLGGTYLNPDRHKDGSRTVTLRLSEDLYDHLDIARQNNRTPRPHDTVGAYIKWLIETSFERKR